MPKTKDDKAAAAKAKKDAAAKAEAEAKAKTDAEAAAKAKADAEAKVEVEAAEIVPLARGSVRLSTHVFQFHAVTVPGSTPKDIPVSYTHLTLPTILLV